MALTRPSALVDDPVTTAAGCADPFVDFLRERSGRTAYELPYSGNAGDALIKLATARLLSDLGIHTTPAIERADLILVPGGNPTMWPTVGIVRWTSIWRRYPHIDFMVGPATFRNAGSDWAGLLNERGQSVSGLFARDRASFRNLQAAVTRPGIRIGLSHDPALYLRGSTWQQRQLAAATMDHDLLAFRDDREANLPTIVQRRAWQMIPGRLRRPLEKRLAHAVRRRNRARALSLAGGDLPIVCRDVSKDSFEAFTRAIRSARCVHTDRLHVMLLAVMLGKTVYAYPTSHGKLEGVYRHSLAGWADVRLVEPAIESHS